MNDGMEGTRPEVAGLGGENSLTEGGTGVDMGAPVGNGPEVIGGENVVGSGELTANDATNSGVSDVNGTEISGAGMPDMNGGNMEPVASEPSEVGSVVEPVVGSEAAVSNPEAAALPKTKTLSSKKSYYIAIGGVIGVAVLVFAGIGVYLTFFGKNRVVVSADIEAEMESRQSQDGEIIDRVSKVQTKTSSEMTNEDRLHNMYVYYGLESVALAELHKQAENIDERVISSQISLEDAGSEYEKLINARSSDNEKAYLLLREIDLIAYMLMEDENKDNIALMGELSLQAENTYPTIASAERLARWEDYYGSRDKAETYYQLMYQRQIDEGYISEIPDNSGAENE
ncbi:MAG: hypothetical protein Q4F60_03275 [Candidatus Saccharibacteria bacterium]|nr:hypothetical protein [Candidatus Saccharibacteria bacterium]